MYENCYQGSTAKKRLKTAGLVPIYDHRLEKIMSGLRGATKDLQQEKERKESVLLSVREKVDQAKADQDMAGAEYDVYMRKVREYESQIKDKQFNLEDYQRKLQGRMEVSTFLINAFYIQTFIQ